MRPLYRQPFIVLVACFVLLGAAIVSEGAFPLAAPFLLVLIAFVSMLVVGIHDKAIKTMCYFALGFTSYWMVGDAFFVPFGEEWRLFSFIPFLMLGIANATAALIGYADGYVSGCIFVSASVLSLLVARGPLDFNSVDRFLIGIVLFAVSAFLYVHYVTRTEEVRQTLKGIAKATVLASLLLGVVFAIRFFDISVLEPENLALVLSGRFVTVFLNIVWLSIVANGFFAALAVLLFNIALYSFDYVRQVADDGSVALIKMAREEVGEEAEERDPYAPLMTEMKKFLKEAGRYDRIKATEIVARFREQFNVLSAKYDVPGKERALALLRQAERVAKERRA
ncbi:MAG: hypothetical protein QXG98_05395 [Candidatus Micrarchaeia archaeon]